MFNRFYLSDDGLMLGFDSEVTVTTTDPIKTDQVKKVKRIEQSVSY
jgi:hypothetical protein